MNMRIARVPVAMHAAAMDYRLTAVLVATAGLGLAACVTSPTDNSTDGTMAAGGVSPRFEMTGYASAASKEVVIEVRDQDLGIWREIGSALSQRRKTVDGLYLWRAKDLQVLLDEEIETRGASSSVELRAREGRSSNATPLATFSDAGMSCLQGKLFAGVSPIRAGRDCTTGNTVNLSWNHDGSNFDNDSRTCSEVRKVFAEAGESGHRLAVRLTPPSWPFEVRQLRYHLVTEDDCRRDLPHRVEVYVGTGNQPAATPVALRSFVRRLPPGPEAERAEFIDLDAPIVLRDGEHLFVSIEMIKEPGAGGKLCVPSCGSTRASYTFGRSWWSNAASTPYSWRELGTFGIFGYPRVGASGSAL